MKKKLTERYVEGLKPPAKGCAVVWDSSKGAPAGFGLRITANNVISFILDYRNSNRESRRFTIGQWNTWLVADARTEASDLLKEISKGADPVQDRIERREKLLTEPTVDDLAKKYMREHSMNHNRGSHQRNNQQMLDNLILPRLGKRRLTAITFADVDALHNWVNSGRHKDGKTTPYRANRVHSLVRSMFNKAIDWGWYQGKNPAKAASKNGSGGVIRFDEEQRQGWQTQLSDEQFGALERAITDYDAREKDESGREITECERGIGEAIRLLILTGSREMEVLRAKWEEFDLKQGIWNRPSHRNKGRKPERVNLSEATLVVLKRMKESAVGPYLFRGKFGKNTVRTTIRRPWVAICKAAGLAERVKDKHGMLIYKPLVRIHDLRHSYASWLVNHGEPLERIGKLLGHIDPKTTHRYAHLADATLRSATNKFGEASMKWVQ